MSHNSAMYHTSVMILLRLVLGYKFLFFLAVSLNAVTSDCAIIEIGCKYDDASTVSNNDTAINGNNHHTSPGCINGKCTCQSLDNALTHLTSNTMINITADVILSSVFVGKDLVNISIVGHNRPTVKCSESGGGLQFVSCNSCKIEGITWNRFGTKNACGQYVDDPTIKFLNSSRIVIQNCSFQHSTGKIIAVSESVDVTISNSEFVNNRLYSTAIYSLNEGNHSDNSHGFSINNCNFSYNVGGTNVVYVGTSLVTLSLSNSVFYKNQGNLINISNANLNISDTVIFEENQVEDAYGGGIFADKNAIIKLCKNSTVRFTNNKANRFGGALNIRGSHVIFEDNSTVNFTSNCGKNGGAVYLHNSTIIFNDKASVKFNENRANEYGGALHLDTNCLVIYKRSSMVRFQNNNAKSGGGAVYFQNKSSMVSEENAALHFSYNSAEGKGGAIYCEENSNFTIGNKSTMKVINNRASYGGAVHMFGCEVTFKGNCNVAFSNNEALIGGALNVINSNICYQENSAIIFSENKATSGNGRAMLLQNSASDITGNSTTLFNKNHAEISGGAICTDLNSHIQIENSLVNFSYNSAKQDGGALCLTSHSDINITGNSAVMFNNNEGTSGGAACIKKSHIY